MTEEPTKYDGETVVPRGPFKVDDEVDRVSISLDLEIIDTLAHTRELNGTDVLVYLTLRAFGRNGRDEVFPSLEALGNRCGMAEDTTSRSILILEKTGLIHVIRSTGNQGQLVSHYRILPITLPPTDKKGGSIGSHRSGHAAHPSG